VNIHARPVQAIFMLWTLLSGTSYADDCSLADSLAANGYPGKAREAYSALIDAGNSAACAADGFAATTSTLIDAALAESKHHEHRGAWAASIGRFQDALDLLDNKTSHPSANLEELAELKEKAAEALVARGDRLTENNAAELATADYRQALEYAPADPHALAGLREIDKKAALTQLHGLAALGDYAGTADALGELAVEQPDMYQAALDEVPGLGRHVRYEAVFELVTQWAGYLALAVIIGFLVHRLWTRYMREPVLAFSPFETESIELKLGDAIDKSIKAHMDDMRRSAATGAIGVRVEHSDETFEIPEAITRTLPSQLSFASAIPELVRNILPRKMNAVSGALHFSRTHGCGITVNLRSASHKRLTGYTFWQINHEPERSGDFGDAPASSAPYFDLCQYVAIWLLYERDRGVSFRPLGCSSWSAYVAFRNGVIEESKAKADKEFSKSCYVKALRLQPEFNAAGYNLARLAERKYHQFTLDSLRRTADEGEQSDPTTYNARYLLANRLFELGCTEQALQEANTLTNAIDCYLRELEKKKRLTLLGRRRRERMHNEALKAALKITKRAVRAMEIGLGILLNKDLGRVGELEDLRQESVTPQVHYNIACTYSIAARVLREELEKKILVTSTSSVDFPAGTPEGPIEGGKAYDDFITAGLVALRTALFLRPAYKEYLPKDPSLSELLKHYDPDTDKRRQAGEYRCDDEDEPEDELVRAVEDMLFGPPNRPSDSDRVSE